MRIILVAMAILLAGVASTLAQRNCQAWQCSQMGSTTVCTCIG